MIVKKDLVSIIVPVYNAEKYLNNCVDSIVNQTYKDIEIILINDGSIDNSGTICDVYASRDNRIKVLHQSNHGPSFTRNLGIASSNGEYIQFVDSDDFIAADMTEKLVEEIQPNNDMVLCGYNKVIRGKDRIVSQSVSSNKIGTFQIGEFLMYFGSLYLKNLINSPCNKLYKSDVIIKNKIQFRNDINMGEDLLFNLEYLRFSYQIGVIKEELYNYTKDSNNNSLTTTYMKDLFENQNLLFQEVKRFLKEYKLYTGDNKRFVETGYTTSIIGVFGNLFHRDSYISLKQKKEQIYMLVNDNNVRKQLVNLENGNLQKRYVGKMIKYKKINILFFYFIIREKVKSKIIK